MEILFNWNGTDYNVTSFDVSMGTGGKFQDMAAGTISMSLEGDPKKGTFEKLYTFAGDQFNQAPKKGNGKLIVKKSKDTQSIEEIEMKQAYFTDLSQAVSRADEKFYLSCVLRATEITISQAKFNNEEQEGLMEAAGS